MRNRNSILFIGIAVILTLFFVLWFFLSNLGLKHDWNEYQPLMSLEPYGHELFFDLLDDANDQGIKVITTPLIDTLPILGEKRNYVYFNNRCFIDSANSAHLIDFVEEGNNAIFFTPTVPYRIAQHLGLNYTYITYNYDDSLGVEMNFIDSSLYKPGGYHFDKLWADTAVQANWTYFEMETFDDSMMVYDYARPHGDIDGAINFASFPVGKGYIYFHLNPRVFGNVHLATEEGFEYTNKVLSHFENHPIYLDRYSENYNYEYQGNNSLHLRESPLSYFFSQDALRYAWYVMLLSVALFLLFRTKRQQRIIPIIPAVDNTSIEFAKALGTLYYQSNNTRYITIEMMKLFHTFNRRRYNIQPAKKGESNADLIARKSRVELSEIKKIFELQRKLKYNDLARMREITPLFEALKNYYQTARK